MQRQSLKFDPQIAALAAPSKENWGTAIGDGLVKVGAVANQMHDRSVQEQLQAAREARAQESHAARMAKSAQGMSLAAQKELRAQQSHIASMREKGFSVMGSAYGGGGSLGCSGGSCSSAVSDMSEAVSGSCADGSCSSAVSSVDTPAPADDTGGSVWGMKYIGKPYKPTATEKLYERSKADPDFATWYKERYGKKSVTRLPKEVVEYEYAKTHPDYLDFKQKYLAKSTTKTRTYAPTPTMKAYQEDLNSIPEDQRDAWKKEHPFIEYRKQRLQSKKMTGGLTAAGIIARRTQKLAQKLGTDDIAAVDFDDAVKTGKVKRTEIEALQRQMATTDQAKTLDRVMAKKSGALAEISAMSHRFSRYANSKNVDTNVAKKQIDDAKQYVPGLDYDEKDLENEEFRRDFLNVTATMLKLQSGLTVSNKERADFERSLGTLSKSKRSNFIGLKQKLLDTKNNYEGIRDIDPVYFNLKYGHRLRQLQNSIEIIDRYLHHDSNQSAPVRDVSAVGNAMQHPQSAAPRPRKIVETRVLKDGRKLAKYDDGTVGLIE